MLDLGVAMTEDVRRRGVSSRSPAVTGAERAAGPGDRLPGDATFLVLGDAVDLAVFFATGVLEATLAPCLFLGDGDSDGDGNVCAAKALPGLFTGLFPPLATSSAKGFELLCNDALFGAVRSCFDGVPRVAWAAWAAASLAAAAASAAPFCICAPSSFAPLMKSLKNDILPSLHLAHFRAESSVRNVDRTLLFAAVDCENEMRWVQ